MSAHSPLRVFLADDHAVVRAGLKALVNSEAGMEVTGEASDGREAVALAPAARPDVIVMDISMPHYTGKEAAEKLLATCPEAKIIALTVHEDRSYLMELLEAGVSGYALKRSAADELIRAIRAVAEGSIYVDPSIAGELLRAFVTPTNHRTLGLSDREENVLRMIAQGFSLKEIAAKFGVGVKTIETYKARSMEKLGLKSRVDIVRYAKESGWYD